MSRERITIEHYGEPSDRCKCSGCSLILRAEQMQELEGALLTAGDPSPVGRCPDPDCDALCYLDRDKDRVYEAAQEMYAALEQMIAHRERDFLDNSIEPYAACVAALRKAKGEQPPDPRCHHGDTWEGICLDCGADTLTDDE